VRILKEGKVLGNGHFMIRNRLLSEISEKAYVLSGFYCLAIYCDHPLTAAQKNILKLNFELGQYLRLPFRLKSHISNISTRYKDQSRHRPPRHLFLLPTSASCMHPLTNSTFSCKRTLANKPQHKTNTLKSLTNLLHSFPKLNSLHLEVFPVQKGSICLALQKIAIWSHI